MIHVSARSPRGVIYAGNSGNTNDSSAGSGADFAHTTVAVQGSLVIPAGMLPSGKIIRVTPSFLMVTGSAPPTYMVKLKLGTTTVIAPNPGNTPSAGAASMAFSVQMILQAIDAPGPAANVFAAFDGNTNGGGSNIANTVAMPVALPTNTDLALQIASQWSAAGTGMNTMRLMSLVVEALN